MDPKQQLAILWGQIMSELADSVTSLEVAASVMSDALDLLEDHGQDQLADQLNYQFLKRLRRLQMLIVELESNSLDVEPEGPAWEIPHSQHDITKN